MDTRQQRNPSVSSDERYTPQWIIDALGPFDLDPCAPLPNKRPYDIAPTCYTEHDDGLKQEWHGTVWLNPPCSRKLLTQFVMKMAEHNNGIALLVNRTDNVLFQDIIFQKAASLLFMRNRVKFTRPDGTTGNPFFGSVLVAFGTECDRRLQKCQIEGKYVSLNPQVVTATINGTDIVKALVANRVKKRKCGECAHFLRYRGDDEHSGDCVSVTMNKECYEGRNPFVDDIDPILQVEDYENACGLFTTRRTAHAKQWAESHKDLYADI
jgi:hypothetical protein